MHSMLSIKSIQLSSGRLKSAWIYPVFFLLINFIFVNSNNVQILKVKKVSQADPEVCRMMI